MLEHSTTNRENVPKANLRLIFSATGKLRGLAKSDFVRGKFGGGPHVRVGFLLMFLLAKACHVLANTSHFFPVSASADCFAVAILTAAMSPHFVARTKTPRTAVGRSLMDAVLD